MSIFDLFNSSRGATGRMESSISIRPTSSSPQLNVLWLYPDVLNLHGGRGDLMALLHVASLIELPLELQRVDDLDAELPLQQADIIFLNSGELKCAPKIISALEKQRSSLLSFVERGGMIIAVGSSGAVLARHTTLQNGSSFAGLGLLDMTLAERESVYGDDLWFETASGLAAIGNQIQVADTQLGATQQPLGRIIYGHGNCGAADEGARTSNIIFTNGLGPLLVKNPRLAAAWLAEAAAAKGISCSAELDAKSISTEDKSFNLIRSFIEKKMQRSG